MTDRPDNGSIGKALEGVRWDIKKPRRKTSLFEPLNRYFNDFPWEGNSEPEPDEDSKKEEKEEPEEDSDF